MKLKYKKMVLLVTMSTMFIGLVVFSMVSPSQKASTNAGKKVEETAKTEKKKKPAKAEKTESAKTTEQEKKVEEVKENVLAKTANKKIIKLVDNYYVAGIQCDIDSLQKMHSNPDLIKKKEVKAKYKYVEDVKNIECYTIAGPEKGSYLVYVYSEYKFKDIKTLAPGLSRLFLNKTKDGKLQIFNGADAKVSKLITETDKTKEVQTLVDKVGTKLEEALSSDADLKKFNEDVLNKNAKTSNAKDTDKKSNQSSDKKSESTKETSTKKSESKKAKKTESKKTSDSSKKTDKKASNDKKTDKN